MVRIELFKRILRALLKADIHRKRSQANREGGGVLGWSLQACGVILVKYANTVKRGSPHGVGTVGKYIIWKHGCSFHSVLSREAGLGLGYMALEPRAP